jgi:hypothetical protein
MASTLGKLYLTMREISKTAGKFDEEAEQALFRYTCPCFISYGQITPTIKKKTNGMFQRYNANKRVSANEILQLLQAVNYVQPARPIQPTTASVNITHVPSSTSLYQKLEDLAKEMGMKSIDARVVVRHFRDFHNPFFDCSHLPSALIPECFVNPLYVTSIEPNENRVKGDTPFGTRRGILTFVNLSEVQEHTYLERHLGHIVGRLSEEEAERLQKRLKMVQF